jgi:hypothetical protein
MIGKKINQLATELAPDSTDLTIIGDPISGVSKKITLAQLGAIFSGAVSFYTNLAAFPVTGDINIIYCAKDTQKLYLWSGSAYVEVFPSQALLDTYQLRSEKGNANGYASLDSLGKVPISQLPSSLMEYLGTWNASTNTPTLANGTGDNGDVYLCNVAGTVNFGAGPITFSVGDWVIYNGAIWERSSGAVGTVTSVAATITGDSLTISGSPVTTSGTLAFAFNGTTAQYIRGNGTLATFPSLTGYVPYTGATANVDLGTHTLIAAKGTFSSSGSGDTVGITHSSGSGIALNITKGGNGEGLYINKTSGSGNAATIIGTLNATTLVKSGGTSSQFLKADGSVDSNTYYLASNPSAYIPLTALSAGAGISYNNTTGVIASTITQYTDALARASISLTTTGTSGAATYNNTTGVLNIPQYADQFVGTVTSVAALTIGTSGTDLSSTVANGTTTPVITLNVPTASATNRGALSSADWTTFNNKTSNTGTVTSVGLSSATSGVTIGSTPVTTSGTITLAIATASGTAQGLLSSTDWTTFNNKQNTLTNPVTGTGTTNYLPKFTGASTIGNSLVYDDGSGIGITGSAYATLTLNSTNANGWGTNINFQQSGTAFGYVGAYGSLVGSTTKDMTIWANSGNGFRVNVNNSSTSALILNTSGNLGLGVTPSAWSSSYRAFQFGATGVLWANATGTDWYLGNNEIYNSSNQLVYLTNGKATEYFQFDGKHIWNTAPSGTAGNAISFTQAMTLNASGNLSIGNTNDTYKLDVTGTGRFTGNLLVSTTSTSISNTLQFVPTNTNGEIRGQFILQTVADTSVNTNDAYRWKVAAVGGAGNSGNWNSNLSFLRTTRAGVTDETVFTLNGYTGAATFSSSVTAGSQLSILGTDGGGKQLFFTGGTTKYNFMIAAQQNVNNALEITPSSAAGGSTFSTPAVVVTGTGSVGIGTTDTSNGILNLNGVLDINKDSATVGARWRRGASTVGYIGTGDWAVNGLGTSDFGISSGSSGALVFGTQGGAERMRITSGGNVEINTGSIKTGEPDTGWGRAAIKIGAKVSGEAFNVDYYLPVSVDGTVYYINLNSSTP